MHNPILVALDVPDASRALELARHLAPHVGAFKIGKELFVAEGPAIVRQIRELGGRVFLDLKFHDIPNTVARAVAVATRLGVDLLTVHASGGTAMLQAAEEAAQRTAAEIGREPPLVLAVTVLTSFDSAGLAELGLRPDVEGQVQNLAGLAVRAGLRGLVCSPRELGMLRRCLPPSIRLVTPGIRTGAEPPDDQKRTLSPKEAMDAGAWALVVGRPIYAAADPVAAARSILASLGS